MFPFSHLLVFTVTLFSQELGVLNTLMQYSGFDLIRTIFNIRKPFEFQGHIMLQVMLILHCLSMNVKLTHITSCTYSSVVERSTRMVYDLWKGPRFDPASVHFFIFQFYFPFIQDVK